MPLTALPPPLRLSPAFPFAGRARELDALRALLPVDEADGGRAALVVGDAGSGKSRLVRELAQRVAEDGAVVLYGACDAVVPAPYRAFVEALEPLVRDDDRERLLARLGTDGRELARLLPSLQPLVGDEGVSTTADADTDRHRLHTAVARLVAVAGERAPVVLVLEDLHWADQPTLLLLRHLVRTGASARQLVVATTRDGEADVAPALSDTLVDLARAEGVLRVRLGGLEDDEVAEFVRLATGATPGPELTASLVSLTGGNAFLVTELWRELVETDAIEVTGTTAQAARPLEAIATPDTVRDVVAQRLGRLQPRTGELLELAATAGAEFELDTVRRASALDEGALLDAIDEAVRSGLLLEAPGRGLAYRFAHELVRRSVADRVSAPRRAEMHLRIAEALEHGDAGSGEPAVLSALARHYAGAAPVGGRERAVHYNLLAARAAADSLAFDEAVERLRTALQLGIDDDRAHGQATLDLGYACHRAGRSVDALQAFRESAALARELDDPELLARAAIGFEEACWRPAIHDEGAVELLEEAVAALGPEPSELRVRLLGALTRALQFRGELEAAVATRDEAIAMARARGDRAALGWVLSAAYWSRGVSTHEEIHAMLCEAVEIGDELHDTEIAAEALWWLVPSSVALCDHAGARRALARLFELARRLNEPFRLHVAEHYASALALCDGDLAEAEAAAERSHEWSRLLSGRDASGVHGVQMFSVRREQGRLAELGSVVRLLAAGSDRSWRPGLAATLAELGMEDEARRELTRIRETGLEPLRRTLWLAGLTYLSDACAVVGDERMAALVYPELEPQRGTNLQVGHLVACYGSADRYLGMLAGTLGEWRLAEEHFERALALNRAVGARTWVAHTLLEWGRMLLRRRAGGDRARAATLLGDATGLAERHGLRGVLTAVALLGEDVEPPQPAPDGLTDREVEILRLVALGLSNREIGRRLVISEHTAANHVRSILRKTDCANRTEAAAYAHRRGLVTA